MKILIKNTNVVFKDCIKKKDILIKDNIIYDIKDNIPVPAKQVIDANGLFCMPGLFDMHVHLREPGFTEKETIKTGCFAAKAGGITSIVAMANTNPVVDSEKTIKLLVEKNKKEKIHIYQLAAVTKGQNGTQLVDFERLKNCGAYGFSDDGFCLQSGAIIEKALKQTNAIGVPLIAHCEDTTINKKENASESSEVARIIAICYSLNCSVHLAHISTSQSINIIKDAKKRGVKITAETCPHYFMLTSKETLKKDANFKMNPPLRSEIDRIAVENALIDGTIDVVATDHAPHEEDKKKDFETAANGVVGLETLLSCVLTNFYHTKKMTLNFIVNLLCKKPAEIMKIKNTGEILKGAIADIILVDVNKKWTVTKNNLHSKSKNSPFIGKTLSGKVKYTFCSGELIYKDTGE